MLKDIGITNAILIKSDVLWEALKIIKAFVSKNARLYVLQDAFYFNVVDEEIEIIATDTNNWIKVTFPVQIVSKHGDFCGILNFSKLNQFLDPKILPIQPITIRLGESLVLEVIYEQGKTQSAAESCGDYPTFKYPTDETSFGFVEMKDFYKKIKDLPKYRTAYNEAFKLLASKTQLKVCFLSENVEKLLPQKGYFEVFDSENLLFVKGMLNNFYKTEIFLKKDAKSKLVTPEELENALKQKNADAIMILEDVLLKKEQILPTPKEKKEKATTKTTLTAKIDKRTNGEIEKIVNDAYETEFAKYEYVEEQLKLGNLENEKKLSTKILREIAHSTHRSSFEEINNEIQKRCIANGLVDYFLDENLIDFQGNITSYSLRNPNTPVYDRKTSANARHFWTETAKELKNKKVDTSSLGKSMSNYTIGYWNAEAEPSVFFWTKNANSGDKWEKICALTHFAEEFRQDAFIVRHKIPKEVAETLLDDEENYLKEFENGFILMPEFTFVFENMTKEDVFTIEKEILQVFGDFTIFTEVKEKDGTTQFSVSFFHQTTKTNENDKRKEISDKYKEFETNIKGLDRKFREKSTQNIQGTYGGRNLSLDLSRLFCADNMGDTSNDLRPYTSVRKEINTMLTKYGRKPCTYASDSKNTGLSAVAVEQKDENTETYEVKGTDYTQADQDEYLQEIFNTIKFNDEESLSTEDLKLAIENLFLDKITKNRLEQLLKEREGKKEAPEPETTTFDEFKELVVRYKVGIYYFVGYKNNKKFNSNFRYHQKLGKGYNAEKTFFVEAMKKEAIFWCKDFDGANCKPKSVLQNAYEAYLGQNNLTESKKTTIDKPKSTPETKEELKISMTKRIDVLKDLLQFADKIGKSALLDRIKVMKDLIKYTK